LVPAGGARQWSFLPAIAAKAAVLLTLDCCFSLLFFRSSDVAAGNYNEGKRAKDGDSGIFLTGGLSSADQTNKLLG
jgi:hypothetical protein